MAIDLSQLDEHSESETLELKESFDNKALETIGAFANTNGGTILIGVRDDGRVTGITLGSNTLEEWVQKMQSKIQPRFLPSVQKCTYKDRTVVTLIVDRSDSPLTVDGRFFKRVGRTNQLMSPEEIRYRLLRTGGVSWDRLVEERATLTELDKTKVKSFIAAVRQAGRRPVPDEEVDTSILEKLGLIESGRPVRAAILLLGKDVRRFYPSAFIKAGRFKSETQIIDDKQFEGTLFEQIENAMMWFQERLETRLVIGKQQILSKSELGGLARREDVWEYPLDALREAVVNAVCHRKYWSEAATTIRLYDDHVEIWNPGSLPMDLSLADLLRKHESRPQNRLIAEAFYNVGIIEQWGSGTLRMAESLKAQGLPPPEFDVSSSPDTFKVIMYAGSTKTAPKEAEAELNARQLKALEYLRSHRSLTAAEYQKHFDTSRASATRDLTELARKGVIVQTGRGKGIAYLLAEK